MRGFSLGAFVALAVLGATACGALDGLSDYEAVSDEPDTGSRRLVDAHSEATTPPSGDDDSIEPDSSETDDSGTGDDAPVETEASGDDASDDGGEVNPDAGGGPDDAETIPDVAPEAAPTCGSMTCGGCCQNGTCFGGNSVSSCGKGGTSCKDCSSQGACSANGSCTTPPVDSGNPKTCNVGQCLLCIPVYEQGCCKSDQTCGCQVVIPGRGPCN